MSSNLLAKIEKLIHSQLKIEDSTITSILSFLSNYRKGMWIYPGILKRKYGVSISDAYVLLQLLEKENILQSYYELYCSHCQKSNGIVHTFNELPETFECELCHDELLTIEHAVLIYKVVKDE